MHNPISENPDVQRIFDAYPEPIREKLVGLRQLILEVAEQTPAVGNIEETLKWGQVSYLTHQPKSGTTIRIDAYQPDTEQVAFFVNCQTSLVESYRQMYPDRLTYEGTRAVVWDDLDETQLNSLKHCIELALTYHKRKKR